MAPGRARRGAHERGSGRLRTMSEDSKGSRRLRRGHGNSTSPIPAIYDDPIKRQIDPEAFATFEQRLDAFTQRRFGALLPSLGKAFFKGCTREEVTDPGLQMAFQKWVMYGFRDADGLRIVDMFAAAGLHDEPEVGRALNAARKAVFRVASVARRDETTRQIDAFDLLREVDFDVLDKNTFALAREEDLLCGWMFPSGVLWRPLGLCTRVPKVAATAVRKALGTLAEGESMSFPELAERRTMKLFWLIYRGAVMAPA